MAILAVWARKKVRREGRMGSERDRGEGRGERGEGREGRAMDLR